MMPSYVCVYSRFILQLFVSSGGRRLPEERSQSRQRGREPGRTGGGAGRRGRGGRSAALRARRRQSYWQALLDADVVLQRQWVRVPKWHINSALKQWTESSGHLFQTKERVKGMDTKNAPCHKTDSVKWLIGTVVSDHGRDETLECSVSWNKNSAKDSLEQLQSFRPKNWTKIWAATLP